ncbi:hypothetical protein BAE44_0012583 [Dichanthelium oligosanthes]|uniref:Uncharacterized protein n=1 Tax=Dichanthelium oligosanthes TaxID=888268 RepID=A0A1E5VMQ1_9POAL|nr:hypothetical protein BAE44_0012583 [Dichanthelium oligosanthes]
MQGGRSASAVEAAKEAAANVGASAWAGKEKTKAVVQEKAAKARARDPAEKAAADARMQDRVREVEAIKQDAMRHNAATKERASAAEHHPAPLGVGAAAPRPVGAGGVHVLDRSSAAPTTTDGHAGVPVGSETGTAATARPAGAAPHDDAAAGFTGTNGVPPASGTAGGRYT